MTSLRPRFGLIGAAGFIAPRHMKAMAALGADLAVAMDPNDSVGILDSHFPDAHFFTEFERFDRHVDMLRRKGKPLTHMAICSPNHLHDAHVRFALRSGAEAICEKPLVVNPWNLDGLAEMEASTGKRVNCILQLRLHASIIALKRMVDENPGKRFSLDLTYITSRGRWYDASWKANEERSGGVAMNIGVHFFDMLSFVFGKAKSSVAHMRERRRAAGFIEFERGDARWFLSIDADDLPPAAKEKRTHRSITMDGQAIEFSEGFTDLHTRSYEEIMAGRGFSADDVRTSIELVHDFRHAPLEPGRGEMHPISRRLAA